MYSPPGTLIKTGEFQTHYIEQGTGEPVILVHGGGAGADGTSNWTNCLPFFARSKRAIAVDMVGFGHSDAPDPAEFTYSQDARTTQLIDFIEALGLEKVSLVGNSMGGATSLGVAMRRPDLVENLVLMGSAGMPGPTSPALAPLVEYDFTVEGMRRIIAALANPHFTATEDQVRYRHELSARPATRAAYTAMMVWVREHSLAYTTEQIAQVKTRTLVVHGKDDLVVPVTQAYEFLDLLENSSGYVIPNCRHWAMIEYPELFSAVTLAFLDGYRGTTASSDTTGR
ncbi:alpha/beta hydrolase [Streptomyces sp. NPDC002588]|uniref:alpha/beta fold hydrolase n=1 Tax=Streptomyces sp. NPDC002588 TaxID=3154419 RepID=UPI003327E5FE